MADKMLTKEEEEEREHFCKVVSAFLQYKNNSLSRIHRTKQHLRKFPLEQQKILASNGFQEHLDALETCVELNYEVVKLIVADVNTMFENVPPEKRPGGKDGLGQVAVTDPDDIDKVQTTVKQFVRDWSSEGAEERKMCYGPILEEILEQFGQVEDKKTIRVLVPGAGLGRLAFEIAKTGFECQGNEFSLYMLMASNFVLNKCRFVNCFKIHPWIHQFTNNLSNSDVLQSVSFPDTNPNELPEDVPFSMTAGDFLEVYSDPEHFESRDCVVTCFFIDCAHNILDFIQLIHKILRPGGKWINLGPLLYHFADMPDQISIEPSYDVVKGLIEDTGFKFLKEDLKREASYMQRPSSMLQFRYQCIFFTCQK